MNTMRTLLGGHEYLWMAGTWTVATVVLTWQTARGVGSSRKG